MMGKGWAAALQPRVLGPWCAMATLLTFPGSSVCGRLCQALYVSCISFASSQLGEAEVEETLKRLQSQKGVQGIIVVNTEALSSAFCNGEN
ncbi:dynein light chain roadblock-type 1 isoform X8 [Pongo pygmaeus]|uniref:dynein light chain roadblock-type 1 isoform X8 n=1 Tax=Pongo pygmaeus TaxID=9600 RepID=UPI00300CB829